MILFQELNVGNRTRRMILFQNDLFEIVIPILCSKFSEDEKDDDEENDMFSDSQTTLPRRRVV